MRFTDKRYLNKGDVGRTRIVSKFLILPLSIGKETRWLERCTYEEMVDMCNNEFKIYRWFPNRWLD